MDKRDRVCVSVYMPTHRTYSGQQEDRGRFKNLLHQTDEMLKTKGVRDVEIDSLMEASRTLLNETEFWRHSDLGLAHFVSTNLTESYRLPFDPGELVALSRKKFRNIN